MTRRRFAAALCLILASAGAAFALNREGEKAYATLKTAPFFAIGGVGYGNLTSEEEKAFRVLLRQPQAVSAFKSLLRDKDTCGEGRLYALLGLRLKDRKTFTQEAAPVLNSLAEVKTMSGCIIKRESVADVARRIQKGQYR